MSDTETRSVAEIMGWRLGHEKQHTFDDDTWYFMPDGETTRLGPPTCDDMLAWLSEKVKDGGWNMEGTIGITYEGGGYVEVYWYCAAGTGMVSGHTLHAALEAAVRAVAEG